MCICLVGLVLHAGLATGPIKMNKRMTDVILIKGTFAAGMKFIIELI